MQCHVLASHSPESASVQTLFALIMGKKKAGVGFETDLLVTAINRQKHQPVFSHCTNKATVTPFLVECSGCTITAFLILLCFPQHEALPAQHTSCAHQYPLYFGHMSLKKQLACIMHCTPGSPHNT